MRARDCEWETSSEMKAGVDIYVLDDAITKISTALKLRSEVYC